MSKLSVEVGQRYPLTCSLYLIIPIFQGMHKTANFHYLPAVLLKNYIIDDVVLDIDSVVRIFSAFARV